MQRVQYEVETQIAKLLQHHLHMIT